MAAAATGPGIHAWLLAHARIGNKKHKPIQPEDLFNLFQQLSTLLQAGMPLSQTLEISASQSQSVRLGEAVREVANRVNAGSPLHEAVAQHPNIFEPHWIQVIRTGELSGELGKLMTKLAHHMKESREARGKVVSALVYPAIIAVVAVVAVVIMFWFVVPTFAQFFNETGSSLPGITQVVIGLSELVQANGVYMIIGIIIGGIGFRYWVKTDDGARLFLSAMLATPLVGPLLLQSAMERFATNLALLLRAGMPLLEALYALEGTFHGNRPFRDCLAVVQSRVASGGRVAEALQQAGLFTPMVVNLVAVGEESGELPKVLEHIAEYYKQKVSALVERITSMIEPVIILGMGVTVAVILAAIYLPMFSMGGAVG
jgi:type IV pilus assembly protein PilC